MRHAKIGTDEERISEVMSRSDMLAMEGSGWDGDLDALRTEPVASLETALIGDVDQGRALERCGDGLTFVGDSTCSTT